MLWKITNPAAPWDRVHLSKWSLQPKFQTLILVLIHWSIDEVEFNVHWTPTIWWLLIHYFHHTPLKSILTVLPSFFYRFAGVKPNQLRSTGSSCTRRPESPACRGSKESQLVGSTYLHVLFYAGYIYIFVSILYLLNISYGLCCLCWNLHNNHQ